MAFLRMDDPGKKNLRLSIKEMALALSEKALKEEAIFILVVGIELGRTQL